MFDIGWGELVLIGIVALIAIGPKELPTVMRSLGQWMGRIRRMASEFQGQFQEALHEAEMDDLKKHADEMTAAITDATNIDALTESETKSEPETEAVSGSESEFEAAEPSPVETVTTGSPAPGDGADRSAEPGPEAATEEQTAEAADEYVPASKPEKPPAIEGPLPEPPEPVPEKDFAPVEPPPERAEGKA